MEDERASHVGETEAPPELTADEKALLEAKNAVLQFDRLAELIRSATSAGAPRFRLRPSTLCELNRLVVQGFLAAPGAFRTGPIKIDGSKHIPPPWEEVPGLVDELCEYVNDEWAQAPIHLASYVMWRLNWIHPFPDGNGRSSRASSYLVLCVRLGYPLPGRVTIPEQIAAGKRPYYRALDAADHAWKKREIDVSAMESILEAALAKQLLSVHESAMGKRISTPVPPGPAWGGND